MRTELGAEPSFSVGEFVAVLNQTLEYAFPSVLITGELANFRVSKGKWIYFDLKDDTASVRFFGTVYQLPGPLEDGMLVQIRGLPRLHPQFGFSVTVQTMQPVGEGSIRRAADLLQAKLAAEGLFDEERKRPIPYPPERIGLVASSESAAYVDFMKIINARWQGLAIELIDVQVQGEAAPAQVVRAVEVLNQQAIPPDVIVVTRGGGSAEDLQAFSTESVTRAVAASRVPTLVAIGHEIDISLAELAADRRASTPSNAAELLVPDKAQVLLQLEQAKVHLGTLLTGYLEASRLNLQYIAEQLVTQFEHRLQSASRQLEATAQLLEALNPHAVLGRGYAVVRRDHKAIHGPADVSVGDTVQILVRDGTIAAKIIEGENE